MTTANEAKVLWDRDKKSWQVEIHVGAEVIKRHFPKESREASVEDLNALAVQTAKDEGYDLEASRVLIVH